MLFTNDGDGGPGQGGTLTVAKAFDQVSRGGRDRQVSDTESVPSTATANPKTDPISAVLKAPP